MVGLNKRLGFRHSDRIAEAIVVSVLVVFAVLTASIALYWIFGSFQPLAEQSVMTVEEWQRLEDETTQLLLKRDRVFAELKELEFERALDKVEPRDYESRRQRYENEALALMDQLSAAFGVYEQRIDDEMTAVVEEARARAKARALSSEPANALSTRNGSLTDAVSEETVESKTPAVSAPNLACGSCGAALEPDSKFCASCGAGVEKTCASCGKENKSDAKFCRHCGTSFGPVEVVV